MDHVDRLIRDLQRPGAYPHEAGDVILHQTHISLVFLAGEFAYKIKKPVDFGFVDYSTLEERRQFCEREVELNRRLASGVYLGVVPVVERDGALAVSEDDAGDNGAVVEWAVKMRRLDDGDTLLRRLADGRLQEGILEALGRLLADFHRDAERGDEISRYGGFEQVSANTLDNFEQTRAHAGDVIPVEIHERTEQLSRDALAQLKSSIQERANAGMPCDSHGDLRLEHVYVSDDGGLTVVDCVEFNDAFRYADPVADVAFLVMDLLIRGWDREASTFMKAWLDATDDRAGRALLDFYVAYRSCVRGKVHGFKAQAEEVSSEDRASALQRAGMHWRFALTVLASARERPRLVMAGGLPGTGKSTVARSLMERGWADEVIRSDVVRKALAGMSADESAHDEYGSGIYTKEWTRRTYEACRERAAEGLKEGLRVVIDASFNDDDERRACVELARELGVQPVFLECRLAPATAAARMRRRKGDASDADAVIHERMREAWQSPSDTVARVHLELDTEGEPNEVADRAVELLAAVPVVPRGEDRG